MDASPISNKNLFEEPHNEIEHIISKRLPFFVRWGTAFFFFLLLALVAVCWFIRYPELVIASGKLNSINAPKEVITRTDGKLQKLLVKNDDSIEAGTVMAYTESIANPKMQLSKLKISLIQ